MITSYKYPRNTPVSQVEETMAPGTQLVFLYLYSKLETKIQTIVRKVLYNKGQEKTENDRTSTKSGAAKLL